MPPWLAEVTLGQLVAVAAAGTLIVAAVRRVSLWLRKVSRFLDAFFGIPESGPGRGDARPGVLDRLASVERTVVEVRAIAVAAAANSQIAARELQPNGGSSTRDVLDDIHRRTTGNS